MTSQTINLNLIPGSIEPVINVSQYDKGQTWNFNIYSGSQPFTIPTGSSITIQGTKPDKTGFQYGCTFSGNVVTAIEQQQMTILSGKVPAEIVITKDDELIGSLNFNIMVEKAALADDTAISETDLPLIEEAVEALSHIDETLETMKGYKEDSEAYAIGKRNGSDVGSSDPAYHNNSRYYAGQASSSASSASGSATSAGTNALISEGYAVGKQNGSAVGSGSPYYQNNAEYYKGQAANSATNAGNSATAASGSATTASNKALVAEGYADGKQNGTDVASGSPYYHNNSKYYSEQAAASAQSAAQSAASFTVDSTLSTSSTNPVQNKVITTDLNNVKQALSDLTATETDNEPYVLSQGKGSLVDMDLVGGTVAWNQMALNGNFATGALAGNRLGTLTVQNNVGTFTINNLADTARFGFSSITVFEDHIYFITESAKSASSNIKFNLWENSWAGAKKAVTSSWSTQTKIVKSASTGTGNDFPFGFDTSLATNGDEIDVKNCMIIDLTQMFGTTIADYIYSLEQATAGAGVAFFRKLFPKSYYAYNAGQLLSVKPSGRKVVGFNQWDEQWEVGTYDVSTGEKKSSSYKIRSKNKITVIPNTDYYAKIGSMSSQNIGVFCYTMSGDYLEYITPNLSTGKFTTPTNCCLIAIIASGSYGIVYNNDICINISDPSKNGTYEPYDSTEYAFPSIDIRGLFKLDTNNKLYADGDVYNADGKITREYGIVDLGTLGWNYIAPDASYPYGYFWTSIGGKAAGLTNMICSKYVTMSSLAGSTDKVCSGLANGIRFYVVDSAYSDAATFTTAMSGVYLVYELITPNLESAPKFVNPQRSFADGTEEWFDERDVTIPVGNNSIYYQNDTYPAVTAYADGLYDVLNEAKAAIAALGDDESGKTTASRPYTQGEFFYMDGKMYKVLTSIAKDAAFTVGTNCSQTTIFAELKALAT